MNVTGYGSEAAWDGDTLTLRGTNRAGWFALTGSGKKSGDITIDAGDITTVEWKAPSGMSNGALTVHTSDGERRQLHFLKKQSDSYRELYDAVAGATGADVRTRTTSDGRDKISEVGQTVDGAGLACPNCGGTQFKAKRSAKGKMAAGLLASKSQVRCVTCGTTYRRG